MSAKTTQKQLGALFDSMVEQMKDIVENGETEVLKDPDGSTRIERVPPKAATLNVIRQFLAQQGINAAPEHHKGLQGLATKLPFAVDEDGDSPQTFQ